MMKFYGPTLGRPYLPNENDLYLIIPNNETNFIRNN